ncbi:MAG: serine--tRNA ligase [Rhodospirillales bacterium]|nr:serine--tRNA ligase [Rhodospirillales bacterium]
MFDIKYIRDEPGAFDAGMKRRGLDPQAEALIEIDARRRGAQTTAQELQTRRNELSKIIGAAKSKGIEAAAEMEEVARSKESQAEAEKLASAASDELHAALGGLPNIPAGDVPDGADENDNVEINRWGAPREYSFAPKEHFDIGEALGLMDFETAAKMSGARFVILSGALARMERALSSFMLDMHTTEFGLTEVNPPALVKDSALFGTGQLPKFADDLFRTENDYWMIPTAEVPLTNMVAGEILDEKALPRRYTAMTWCFRSEAGSAGKDTRGMIRQHQFTKVEMVSIVHPDKSSDEHNRMTGIAEGVLKRLNLPFRTVVLCTGDLGFSAQKTHDIEVWLAGQGRYREISSISNCGDFQARRMNARFRPAEGKGTRFLHTLNGSGLAVGRTLIAVIENYQLEDGSIEVPEALRPYMGGLEVIKADV